jgi:hypothetical protein
METEKLDMKARILGKIKAGEISMRTPAYFALRVAALALVALFALAVSILICTFILFTIRMNAHDALEHAGISGWWFFARFFPWHLLALDIVLIAAAEWLLRGFKFAYRSPALYVLFALLALALALGLFIDRTTGFNDDMQRRARLNGLPPPLNALYLHVHRDDLFPPHATHILFLQDSDD